MGEWKECKLGEIANVIGGFAFKGKHFSEAGDEFVVKIKNIDAPFIVVDNAIKVDTSHYDKPKLEKFRLRKGDYAIAMTGATIGKIGRLAIDTEAYINQRVAKIESRESVSKDFVYYTIHNNDFQMFIQNNIDSHSAQENISATSIGRYPILLPPLPEQKAIASVLSSLDDKIDLLHRQNKTLEAMAETLFRQWFIEEAKDDWEDGCLGDIIELVYGKGLKKEIRTGTGFPVVGSSGVVGHHSEFLVEGPGIVIGRKGTLGKVIYLWENFFPIDTTYYIRSKVKSVGLLYEYFLLKTLNFEEMNSDSAVPGLNRDIALSTEIKIAPLQKLQEFNQFASVFTDKLLGNQKQIRTLEKLRDTLLPKLMSGEVRVEYEN